MPGPSPAPRERGLARQLPRRTAPLAAPGIVVLATGTLGSLRSLAVEIETVTAPAGGLLEAVRRTLDHGDEALLCVAFAQARGVHLVAHELQRLARRGRARVVVTTTLGATSPAALAAIGDSGAALRVLNPGGATYHPKVFLARSGGTVRAVVGSANLTSGLVANVEAGMSLVGSSTDPPLARLWGWAESVWDDPRSKTWEPGPTPVGDEAIEPELLALLAAAARANPVVYTLGPSPRPNRVTDVTESGLWVETDRSRARADGPQVIPPRMLNLAWDVLRSRGRLSNRELLDELRVHRSSFVCAILARLPGVTRVAGRGITLRHAGPTSGVPGRGRGAEGPVNAAGASDVGARLEGGWDEEGTEEEVAGR